VEKHQRESLREGAKRVVKELQAKRLLLVQESVRETQETAVKKPCVSSSLRAWRGCEQEKLADDASSQQLVLARMSAKVESPTCVTLGTVSFAGLCQDVKQ